jgi:hypothetical protein
MDFGEADFHAVRLFHTLSSLHFQRHQLQALPRLAHAVDAGNPVAVNQRHIETIGVSPGQHCLMQMWKACGNRTPCSAAAGYGDSYFFVKERARNSVFNLFGFGCSSCCHGRLQSQKESG